MSTNTNSFTGTDFLAECVNNIYVYYNDGVALTQDQQLYYHGDPTCTGVPGAPGDLGFFADGTYYAARDDDADLRWLSLTPAYLGFNITGNTY